MIGILTTILSAIGISLRHAWTFVKAKALILWAFVTVFLPRLFDLFQGYRAIRLAALGGVFYLIYRVIHDSINAIVITVNLVTGIGSLMQDLGWASWLIWDGPLQMAYLWDQLVACVSFKISLNLIAYAYTKIKWFTGPLFSGGLGPRRP